MRDGRTPAASRRQCPEGLLPPVRVRARWAWTAPEVWTERMLTALEQGVRGGRWHTLIDKVYALPTLRAAFARVKANRGAAGVDHVTVAMFEARLDANLAHAVGGAAGRARTVRRRFAGSGFRKGPRERRPLGIPTVRDRVVQTALRLVLEPIFERDVCPAQLRISSAARRKRRAASGGRPAARGLSLRRRCGPAGVLRQHPPRAAARAGGVEGQRRAGAWRSSTRFCTSRSSKGWRSGRPRTGTPQGAVISPLLANLYLDPLDHAMAAAGFEMVRYADDFVVLCRTAEDAQQALAHRATLDGGGGPAAASREDASRGDAAARRL